MVLGAAGMGEGLTKLTEGDLDKRNFSGVVRIKDGYEWV